MDKALAVRFRQDLKITKSKTPDQAKKIYFITNPTSGETFEFREEEFFLYQSLDGVSSTETILVNFQKVFGLSLTETYFINFIQQSLELGLLESISATQPIGVSPDEAESDPELESSDSRDSEEAFFDDDEERPIKQSPMRGRYPFCNPEGLFQVILLVIRPFRHLFFYSVWGALLLLPVAIFNFFKNQALIWQDMAILGSSFSYFGSLLFSILSVNLVSRLIQGTVCTYYHGQVREFGLVLRFGLVPHFYIDKSSIQNFSRNQKLWAYGTTLLFRIFLFVIGVLVWYSFRGSGRQLATAALLLAQAGLIGFLLLSLPIRTSDGYKWLVTYFRLPPKLIQQALQILVMKIRRQPLPTGVSFRRQLTLLVYALFLLVCWVLFFLKIVTSVAGGLESSFPGILGSGTGFFILGLVSIIVLRWLSPMLSKLASKGKPLQSAPTSLNSQLPTSVGYAWQSWPVSQLRNLFLLCSLGIVIWLPFPYRPGGTIQLLPPKQQAIPAPVTGKIAEVVFSGGDGALIKSGAVIATITAAEVDNTVLTLNEQIKAQTATLQREQAHLNLLLAGPRSEAIEVSQKQVAGVRETVEVQRKAVAKAQAAVKVAEQELETAIVKAQYSAALVARIETLSTEGALALQRLEDAREQAAIDRIGVEQKRNQLATQQKNLEQVQQELVVSQRNLERSQADLKLLLSGAPPQNVEAARQQVAAARAELGRLEQERRYAQTKQKSAQLTMPFDGYLVDSFLKQKVGSYINQGQTFATAQIFSKPVVQLQLPEYDVAEVQVGSQVEVKLLTYPNKPLLGRVIAIEPATSHLAPQLQPSLGSSATTNSNTLFKVSAELVDVEGTLKPGMSGYGKIDVTSKPLIVLLTRPILRFVQVEIWSWLP